MYDLAAAVDTKFGQLYSEWRLSDVISPATPARSRQQNWRIEFTRGIERVAATSWRHGIDVGFANSAYSNRCVCQADRQFDCDSRFYRWYSATNSTTSILQRLVGLRESMAQDGGWYEMREPIRRCRSLFWTSDSCFAFHAWLSAHQLIDSVNLSNVTMRLPVERVWSLRQSLMPLTGFHWS